MKLSLLFFIIVVVSSCHSKYQLHEHYLSDAYEKSIDTVVYAPYRKGDKWFYVDRRTKGPYAGHAKAFKGEWEEAYPFNSSNLAKVFSQGAWSFIDTTGKEVIETKVKEIFDWDFSEGVVSLPNEDNLWGCLNNLGDTLLPFKFTGIGTCRNNFIIATYGENTYALFNKEGEVLIDSGKYSYIAKLNLNDSNNVFSYGVFKKGKKKYGLLNNQLEPITEPKFDNIQSFHNERGAVYLDGKFGFINLDGKLIVKCIFNEAENYHNDFTVVAINEKYGTINKNGNISVPIKYNMIGMSGFQDDIIPAKRKGKWGIINSKGKIEVRFKYDLADFTNYKYGLIPVEKNGLIGMIDARGKEIITFREYESVLYFYPYTITPNRIVIKEKPKNGKYGLINRKNEAITPLKYSSIGKDDYFKVFENGLIPVGYYINGEYRKGYIDIWGKEYFED